MRRVCVGVLVVAAGVGACGVPTDDGPRAIDAAELPEGLLDAPATTPAFDDTALDPGAADVYFVRDGQLVEFLSSLPSDAPLETLVRSIASGPPADAAAAGTRSAFGTTETLEDVSVRRGVARIDLATAFDELPPADVVFALAQIVLTVTGRPGIGQVEFRVDGRRVAVPIADGTVVNAPVSRDDYEELLRASR